MLRQEDKKNPIDDYRETVLGVMGLQQNENVSDEESFDSDESGELYERKEFVADPKQGMIRLDKFIADRMSGKSRNKIQSAIRAGSVLVDNKEVKPNYRIKPGNMVSLMIPRTFDDLYELEPQNIPLDIVYEDNDLMVINKPAKLAVHPGVGIPKGTVVNAILYHLKEQAAHLPILAGNDASRAGIVHRIDKDTTGLMVIAKNDEAIAFLAKQFFEHTIERRYVALVWGDPKEDSGTIISYIGRNPNDRRQFMVFPEGEDGKYSVTHWKVLERYFYCTLIECKLETGRTHQIRVHMKSIGHTLFGDPRYGGNQILKGTVYSKYKSFVEGLLEICPRQALHAKVLGFVHPVTKEKLYFESELPKDMQTVIEKWKLYLNSRKQP